MKSLNKEIEQSGRRLVVITDPHIKIDYTYRVYAEGTKLQNSEPEEISIWV